MTVETAVALPVGNALSVYRQTVAHCQETKRS
jgi:hypothetical protein